jgi:hypothetical protein
MGFVEFDEVIVAFDAHGAAGDVVDEVMAEAMADAIEPDARGIGVIDAGEMVDMTVFHHVPAGGEGAAIATGHGHAAAAEGVEITGLEAMVLSASDFDAVAGHFADGAAFEVDGCPAFDEDTIGGAAFPEETLEADVGSLAEVEKGLAGDG